MPTLKKHLPFLIVVTVVITIPFLYRIIDTKIQEHRCEQIGKEWNLLLKSCK
ncbi:MAG: hypothetical protein H6767_08330 [Candidatus Peribacteria bacterium]|nr:MAG: hypothetical protein H6767_08330 [Candidatus Peribacteria bacterium]